MSTTFVTKGPMTLANAVHLLTGIGCAVTETDHHYACLRDPKGNYFHLTDDVGSYTTLSIDISSGEMAVYPTEVHDGTVRVMGECYGVNDASVMADALGMLCEHEHEYHDIIGPGIPCPTRNDGSDCRGGGGFSRNAGAVLLLLVRPAIPAEANWRACTAVLPPRVSARIPCRCQGLGARCGRSRCIDRLRDQEGLPANARVVVDGIRRRAVHNDVGPT